MAKRTSNITHNFDKFPPNINKSQQKLKKKFLVPSTHTNVDGCEVTNHMTSPVEIET